MPPADGELDAQRLALLVAARPVPARDHQLPRDAPVVGDDEQVARLPAGVHEAPVGLLEEDGRRIEELESGPAQRAHPGRRDGVGVEEVLHRVRDQLGGVGGQEPGLRPALQLEQRGLDAHLEAPPVVLGRGDLERDVRRPRVEVDLEHGGGRCGGEGRRRVGARRGGDRDDAGHASAGPPVGGEGGGEHGLVARRGGRDDGHPEAGLARAVGVHAEREPADRRVRDDEVVRGDEPDVEVERPDAGRRADQDLLDLLAVPGGAAVGVDGDLEHGPRGERRLRGQGHVWRPAHELRLGSGRRSLGCRRLGFRRLLGGPRPAREERAGRGAQAAGAPTAGRGRGGRVRVVRCRPRSGGRRRRGRRGRRCGGAWRRGRSRRGLRCGGAWGRGRRCRGRGCCRLWRGHGGRRRSRPRVRLRGDRRLRAWSGRHADGRPVRVLGVPVGGRRLDLCRVRTPPVTPPALRAGRPPAARPPPGRTLPAPRAGRPPAARPPPAWTPPVTPTAPRAGRRTSPEPWRLPPPPPGAGPRTQAA